MDYFLEVKVVTFLNKKQVLLILQFNPLLNATGTYLAS